MHESFSTKKEPTKVGNTPVPPLEEIDRSLDLLLYETHKQLEVIGESLIELALEIETNKPDAIVFLDLSARILGSPYKKYLRETMGNNAPQVRFYNDHELKGRFLAGKDIDDIVQRDFDAVQGQKVFFIDETFSHGKGAAAILSAANIAGVDAYYYALSRDPSPSEKFELTTSADRIIQEGRKSGRIIIYDNYIKNLFPRMGSRLYMQDIQGQTMPLAVPVDSSQGANNVPDARSYTKPPEGMSIEEYEKKVSQSIDSSVRDIKDLVYKTLVNHDDK